MKNSDTPWYVITGSLSSGKTTIISELATRGYTVTEEMARFHIERELKKGKTIEEIRRDENAFQEIVLKLKIEREKKLPREEMIFFDRGIPDSAAYYKVYEKKDDGLLAQAMSACTYKKIFLLDLLPYEKDEVRIESEETRMRIHQLLKESYRGFPVIPVPVLPITDRVDYILHHI